MPRNSRNNRTDLMGPRKEPISAATGQAYGRATAQRQSQAILPVGPTPVAAPGAAPQAAPAQPGGAPSPSGLGLPKLPWLDPTTHGLPPTHGRPYGPGAGPEALTGIAAKWQAQQLSEQGSLQQLLRGLATSPGASSAVKQLAASAGAGGIA